MSDLINAGIYLGSELQYRGIVSTEDKDTELDKIAKEVKCDIPEFRIEICAMLYGVYCEKNNIEYRGKEFYDYDIEDYGLVKINNRLFKTLEVEGKIIPLINYLALDTEELKKIYHISVYEVKRDKLLSSLSKEQYEQLKKYGKAMIIDNGYKLLKYYRLMKPAENPVGADFRYVRDDELDDVEQEFKPIDIDEISRQEYDLELERVHRRMLRMMTGYPK